jgi:hypothetical protein
MIREYLRRSMSFPEYVGLIERLLSQHMTTGPDQSDAMFNYTKLNRQRMRRLERTIELDEFSKAKMAQCDRDMIWLVVTEGWCGDAAQNVPIIEKLAAANSGIETRYILRDENPALMDRFLTGGSRSIPKLIAIDRQTGEVLGTWGPRPAAAQAWFDEMKAAGLEKPLMMENLQRWYLSDRGRSLQQELVELLSGWTRTSLAKAA